MSRIKNIVNLTEKAVTQLRKIEKPEHVLQFSLKGGGCAGMKQELKYVPKDKLDKYDEIIVIGSGKGVVSVSSVDKPCWKRKSLKNYRILSKVYQHAITNCPRYNG